MAATTVGNVRAIASHLGRLPDSTIQMYIDDAQLEMQNLKYQSHFEEKIMRYLAAHYGTLQVPKVKQERVDGLGSQTFSDNTGRKEGLNSTEYGQEVLRMLKKSNPGILVIS
ncbi:DUF4054 domain-containing protein [Anaerosolibacter sp.]|uniref:DUF4054 domain-containing protein n=1 Tax=Anaerosolibacter sp. TaxID=1872527 RepID=UPI0039F01512